MTRKDYILIADKLREQFRFHIETKNDDLITGYSLAVSALCDALKSDNPRFDSGRLTDYILKDI